MQVGHLLFIHFYVDMQKWRLSLTKILQMNS